MKIEEMNVGQNVKTTMVLADASLRKTKGKPPKDYLFVTLTDGTDSISGNIWDYKATGTLPATGKVYDVTGAIGEYLGKKQITPTVLTLAEDQDMTEFMCTYNGNLDTLWRTLQHQIDSIGNYVLRHITREIYNNHKDAILMSSSAKAVHHVGVGGNAAHTIEVFNYANSLVNELEITGKLVSRDLVSAGALLHDIGKISTYSIAGPVIDYTFTGQLLEHITIGIDMVRRAAFELNVDYIDDEVNLLCHIIASHHGKVEYGSPVTPRFAEAYIVNIADGMSATMDVLYAANDKAVKEGKPITDKIYTLDNREHILQTTVDTMLPDRSNSEFEV